MAAWAQPMPQSCRNTPMPTRPLAKKVSTVFSGGPELEQLVGIDGNAGSPMICTGMDCAFSPAMCMSASLTGPQLKPSANCMHSTSGSPFASTCCGSASAGDSAEDNRRRPDDPVSISTLSMVWQLVLLPGAQTVMLTKGMLITPTGPALTLSAWTFWAAGALPPATLTAAKAAFSLQPPVADGAV